VVAAVLGLDRPPAERATPGAEGGAGEIPAVLDAQGEGAAQRVEAEDGIGARNDVDAGDGGVEDEVPAYTDRPMGLPVSGEARKPR
jgi:hypothetical protein